MNRGFLRFRNEAPARNRNPHCDSSQSFKLYLVEMEGIEPTTSCLQSRRSPI